MDIGKIARSFARDLVSIVEEVMSSNVGINPKVGHNTLADSDLFKQLKVVVRNDGDLVFDIMLNDYIQFIESGRRAGAKFPPIQPIVNWAKKHGIPTDNSTIFLIRRAISRDGIRPRPIMVHVFNEIDREWENGHISDQLFNDIMEIIDKFFEQ